MRGESMEQPPLVLGRRGGVLLSPCLCPSAELRLNEGPVRTLEPRCSRRGPSVEAELRFVRKRAFFCCGGCLGYCHA